MAIAKVLVTGSNGFLGEAVIRRLLSETFFTKVVSAARRVTNAKSERHHPVLVSDLSPMTDWSAALMGVEVVVHCAARVHVMQEAEGDSLKHYRLINVGGTLNLARQAADAGVRRFLFISSSKVNGETTLIGQSFTADDVPAPLSHYGTSKLEAEYGLRQISRETGMEVVVVRPPLVYGPGVKANFAALIRAVERGWVLPLGAVNNQRSLVALDNLVDLILTCIIHPQAANQIFLVSDGQDLSTTELLRRMAQAAGVPSRLLPVPVWALKAGGSLLGRGDLIQRLCCNLQLDISKTRNLLDWSPLLSVEDGLKRAMAV